MKQRIYVDTQDSYFVQCVSPTFIQALICMGVGLPVVFIALILQRFDPLN